MKQVVLWIGANAGGVSKTTLAVHIGYEMAKRGFDVALLDLDTNVSMSQFCGLDKDPPPEQTIATVFDENFDGNWPLLTPEWGRPKGQFQVCLGGPVMIQVGLELAIRNRREYILADMFEDFPLPHRLVILDCPATLGHLNDVALAVATHMLIPVELSPKSLTGANALLSWHRGACKNLRLNPPPQILGFLPTKYDSNEAAQRDLLSQLPEMLAPLKIKCYSHIRYSCEFSNASGRGIPLHLHRPTHKAIKDLHPICQELSAILQESKGGKKNAK